MLPHQDDISEEQKGVQAVSIPDGISHHSETAPQIEDVPATKPAKVDFSLSQQASGISASHTSG